MFVLRQVTIVCGTCIHCSFPLYYLSTVDQKSSVALCTGAWIKTLQRTSREVILKKKLKIGFVFLAILVFIATASLSCVTPKKTKTPTPTPVPTAIPMTLSDTQVNLRVLESKFADLTNKLTLITSNEASYQPDIATLKANTSSLQANLDSTKASIAQIGIDTTKAVAGVTTATVNLAATVSDIATAKSDIVTTKTDIATHKTNLTALGVAIDALKTQVASYGGGAPKYALVNSIGRRYIGINVYGVGDYPIAVTIFGTGLSLNQTDTGSNANISDEYIFGSWVTTVGTIQTTIPAQTVTIGGQPVVIPAQIVNIPTTTLTFNGTMLVVVVTPGKAWIANDSFEIDTRYVSGTIYSATANVVGN